MNYKEMIELIEKLIYKTHFIEYYEMCNDKLFALSCRLASTGDTRHVQGSQRVSGANGSGLSEAGTRDFLGRATREALRSQKFLFSKMDCWNRIPSIFGI